MPVTIADIIFRGAGAWGAGKGVNLDASEVDENFWALLSAIIDLQDNPIEPNNIAAFQVSGNQLTVLMEDASTFGPYTLPVAAFNWTGEWQPNNDYALYDLFSQTDGLYLVVQAYTSAATFNAADGNMAGPYAVLIVPVANLYDIGFFFPGQPGLNIEAGEAMFTFRAPRSFYLPANIPASVGGGRYAADGEVAGAIMKNDTEIGAYVIGAGTTEVLFVFPDTVQFDSGDLLRVIRPDLLDDTLRDFTITFVGLLGTVS